MKAVIYTRISRDDKGDEAGVQRQEEDCRKWCEEHGHEVVGVFCDNDISAMGGKKRPDYLRMLEGIKSRAFDAVVTWHQDRITRSPYEMEEYISICGEKRGGMPTFTLNGGPLDLTTPEGRLQARFGVMIAQYYVEHNRHNNLRAKRQQREHGVHQGSLGFGWRKIDKDHIEPIPELIPVIRGAYADFLNGATYADIVNTLTEQGIKPMQASKWTRRSVAHMLRSPTHAGLIEYMHGERNSNRRDNLNVRGELFTGNWEGIIEREVWDKAVAKIMDPTKRQRSGKHYSYNHRRLLSAIMLCDVCGKPVTTDIRPSKTEGRTYDAYKCMNNHGQIKVSVADKYVVPIILKMVSETRSIRNAARMAAEIKRIEAKLIEVGEAYGNDEITRSQMAEISHKLRDRRAVVEKRLASLDTDADAGTIEWWLRLDHEAQRAVVRDMANVTLKRARQGTIAVEHRITITPRNGWAEYQDGLKLVHDRVTS